MKRHTLLLTLLIFISIPISAQLKKGSKEKIRVYKIGYITEQLDLTEEEATKFWPVYNTYDKKINELRRESKFKLKKQFKEAGSIDSLSDKEAKEVALKIMSINKDIYNTTNTFYSKLPEILSYKKIIKLEISEREFHRKLIRKLRHKRKFKK